MESDFTTRQHLDSVVPYSDPGIGELLNRYKHPPVEPKMPQFSGATENVGASNGSSNMYISNMLGQLQGVVQSMMNNVTPKESPGLSGSGLQLSINADILRWMVVLAFAIVLVVVLFQYMNYRKARNPYRKRLKRLENEIRALRGRKNPIEAIEQDEPDED